MDIASICETGGEANKHDSIGVLEDVHCACLAVADAKAGTAAAETVVSSFLTDFRLPMRSPHLRCQNFLKTRRQS